MEGHREPLPGKSEQSGPGRKRGAGWSVFGAVVAGEFDCNFEVPGAAGRFSPEDLDERFGEGQGSRDLATTRLALEF